ncbi:tRNA N6-adenosine threonylcarbamoyltransferase, mitochondrial [Hanseniaspora osmophila]|uniref:N(6)-L-threonylcarbamoyladenine synthase n=1 Tax=Hanseniaspora osmophila TaxID=56408 RepID=A0A1E5RNX2_9ASCO|nr:tRNA N6-adenosine threonylcarbamoyltransferase, mitochondrial [Hanseniaspora osmophila]
MYVRRTLQKYASFSIKSCTYNFLRRYNVLAIETSCDDTCVSIVNTEGEILVDLKKSLKTVEEDGGIIPTKAHIHHQVEIGDLARKALEDANVSLSKDIEFIACTRGPGMPGSLGIGYDFAKGLSVASGKPLIGVHHMLGHLLMPTMFDSSITFPNYSMLCSGGHTVLVYSENLYTHNIIVDTLDIAIGDSLDKCGRELGLKSNMIGKEMEKYINDEFIAKGRVDDAQEINQLTKKYPITEPLKYNLKQHPKFVSFSFSGYLSNLKKIIQDNDKVDKPGLCYLIQEHHFKHLINKINDARKYKMLPRENVPLILSGGVGSNLRLRAKLEHEVSSIFSSFHFPPVRMCTDNAVMIGWAGIKLYDTLKLKTNYNTSPIRKWPLDELLTVDGWAKVE